MVVQADDVARERLFRLAAVGRHEGQRVGYADLLREAAVVQTHAARVAARAEPHERDPVTMARIHIRLDLEHKTRQPALEGIDLALTRLPRQRARSIDRE